MTLVLGKGRGLSIVVDRAVADACLDVQAQLAERAEFYRGSDATVVLGERTPTDEEMIALRDVLAAYDVRLAGVSGPAALEAVAAAAGVAYLGETAQGAVAPMPRARPARAIELSESARSLVADFAGARADLAKRREAREETAARSHGASPAAAAARTQASAAPSVLYHRGTLRGGQSLQFVGDLVIVGDVNPGAEITASGDIVVFGALRGVAHAGAQGDVRARVVALELEPTQLRIATCIAADPGTRRGPARGPEHAAIVDGRIAVVPHAKADFAPREAGS